jgi:pyocin large subunit-like protein
LALTKGFGIGKLLDHYDRRRFDFPQCRDQYDYLDLADAFLGGPPSATAITRYRGSGDLVRYDPATREFGILRKDGIIKTYFLLKKPNAMEYFEQECAK